MVRKTISNTNKVPRELPRRFLSSTWAQNGPKILPEGIQNHSKCPHNDKRSSSWCSFLLWDHNEDIRINVWTCKPSQLEPQTVPEGLVPSSWRRFCGPHAFEWTILIFPPIFPPFTLWEKDSGHLSVTGLSPLCIHQRWRRYVIFLLFNHSPPVSYSWALEANLIPCCATFIWKSKRCKIHRISRCLRLRWSP